MNSTPMVQHAAALTPAGKTTGIILLALASAVGVYFALPSDVSPLARRTAAIFVIAAVFWATEVIPLFATSLCIIGLQILLLAESGGWAGSGGLKHTEFLQPFASGVIILFMGGLLLAAAVTRHGLDQAIAARVLRPFAARPIVLVYAVLGLTAFFSMWMSNTATAAMMLALIGPILRHADEEPGRPNERFYRGLVLAVPFGANIGGIGTPIGSPPNAIALAALRLAGYQVSFLEWMVVAVPLMLLLLAITGAIICVMFPAKAGTRLAPIADARPIDRRGKLTLAILVLAIGLWLTGHWHGLADAAVALIAAALLTAVGVLGRRDVDSIDWNILLLMWGGLSLGHAMQITGLVGYVVGLPIAGLGGLALAAIVVGLAVGLSTFMSNTAAASLLIPAALALSAEDGGMLAILTALACSFAMAMPISTPPNALAFATGRITAGSMLRAGSLISVVCVILLLMGYRVMLPLVLK